MHMGIEGKQLSFLSSQVPCQYLQWFASHLEYSSFGLTNEYENSDLIPHWLNLNAPKNVKQLQTTRMCTWY